MNVQDALDLADNLLFTETGKRLNDLEREVFIGSWNGKTYECIYPTNPEYVEKYVGYKLWKKLSLATGEKVSKKSLRGAIQRLLQRQEEADRNAFVKRTGTHRVFLSHCCQELDLNLAGELCKALAAAGHQVFMVSLEASQENSQQDWLSQIDTELVQCDYLLILLSARSALSEMAIEVLRKAKELRETRQYQQPQIITIRVHYPLEFPLNHDLRSYIQETLQFVISDLNQTATLQQDILSLLAGDRTWETVKIPEDLESETSLEPSAIANPSPVAEPELPKGQVRLASAFYIDRVPHEKQCYEAITQPGVLIRIKAPRQMGKTSLMARILYYAREQGYRTVPLSFQHADAVVFTNLNQLLRWFCAKTTRKLRLPYQIDEFWTDTYGSKDNCTAYFEDCLLSATEEPLVLGLDEVDRVFNYPTIADDFFGLLRAWHEDAGYGGEDSGLWEKLRLVVVHSTEVYIPLDVNQSPFNVGLPIELTEFNREQVMDLAMRHGLNWYNGQIDRLMGIVGGHPYLIRLALYYIAQGELTVEDLIETAPTEAGIYGDHLRRHLWNLRQYSELAQAYARVVRAIAPVELESIQAFKLHSMGLVNLRGNEVTPRSELYRQYFGDRLNNGL